MSRPSFRLLIFTDATECRARARGVVETVARAGNLWGCALVVRAKDRSIDDVTALCVALQSIVRHAGGAILAHTHAALVPALGLDGVHLSSDASAAAARALVGERAIVGASRHAGDALDARATAGLDYVTMSPVFPPRSKPDDARATLGLEGLHRACERSAVPVFALGGIDEESARACRIVGAHGAAAVGRVMGAQDPSRALAAIARGVSIHL